MQVPCLFVLCYVPLTPPAASSANAQLPSPGKKRERGRLPTNGGRVIYRRDELSKATIDRDWPHQVALPAYRRTGGNYVTIHLFCDGLSLCPRGHSFYRDGTDMNVFCFAERAHAEQFRERFGGEFLDPKSRPKWPGSR
jgi:hypothetical protein